MHWPSCGRLLLHPWFGAVHIYAMIPQKPLLLLCTTTNRKKKVNPLLHRLHVTRAFDYIHLKKKFIITQESKANNPNA